MRESSIERVVGAENSEIERQIFDLYEERFFSQDSFKAYKDLEKEKSVDEMALIDLANDLTSQLLEKYGKEPLHINHEKIHIFPKDAVPELQKRSALLLGEGLASYVGLLQGAYMREQSNPVLMLEAMTHELVHFKSYNALQVSKDEADVHHIKEYRIGIESAERVSGRSRLLNLNEAVTEEIALRLVRSASDHPLITKHAELTKRVVDENRDQIPNPEEVILVEEIKGKNVLVLGPYRKEKKMLNTLNKLFDRNRNSFADREAVFDVFARAAVTGVLLPLGRLVDGTFGSGTLRKIGESDADIDSQLKLVESL